MSKRTITPENFAPNRVRTNSIMVYAKYESNDTPITNAPKKTKISEQDRLNKINEVNTPTKTN